VIGETEIRLFKWSNQIGFLIADSKTLLQWYNEIIPWLDI
jgi:hypothetical protein